MSAFKGTQGKLKVREIQEDFYISIDNEKDQSAASISTREEQYEEALIYGNLFACAPEMLEMLIDIKDYLGSDKRQEVEQLIKKATL